MSRSKCKIDSERPFPAPESRNSPLSMVINLDFRGKVINVDTAIDVDAEIDINIYDT